MGVLHFGGVFRVVLVTGPEGVFRVVHVLSAEGVWRAECVRSTVRDGSCMVW